MGIFNNIIILQKFQMQSGIPNHYPKFSKLHQFAYIIEPHHQEKGRCDQIQLKNIWGISLTLIYIWSVILRMDKTMVLIILFSLNALLSKYCC